MMRETKRRAAFRNGVRRGGRSGRSLDLRRVIKIVTSSVRCAVWCLLNALLSLWDLNPLAVAVRRWRKSRPKQASIALTVRPRFRDLIGDWFLSYEGRKRKLLQWVHSMLPWLSEDVMDLGPSWQDGIVLCALMDTLNPGSCMQVHLLKPHHRVNNCRLGIQLAMTYLDINQATLSPEEMSLAEEGTEVKLVQLVQLVRWRFLKQGCRVKVESHVGPEEPVVPFKCEARGTGIKAGIVGKRTKFNLFVESVKHLHLSIEIKGPNNEYNKETVISMQPRGPSKYSQHNVTLTGTEDETKAKVVEDGEGHSFMRQKSFDEGPSHLVIPFDYQCVGAGRFLATYIPRNAGLHYITILSHGNHIPGSPFEVKVSDWVSSLNLVPKARVVPFDMINNYVEGVSKEGVKSADKCKLSSVASVSRQLTTMRRRILKKVITQGGKEIIVKQSGDIALNSPCRQADGTSCSYRIDGVNCPKMSTIEEKRCLHKGENRKDDGHRVHQTSGLFSSHNPHSIASNASKPPIPPPSPGHASSNTIGFLSESYRDSLNLMDDFKNVKMDISDKWKIAALKVSISEMANTCDDSALSIKTPVSNNITEESPHIANAIPHKISINVTQHDTKEESIDIWNNSNAPSFSSNDTKKNSDKNETSRLDKSNKENPDKIQPVLPAGADSMSAKTGRVEDVGKVNASAVDQVEQIKTSRMHASQSGTESSQCHENHNSQNQDGQAVENDSMKYDGVQTQQHNKTAKVDTNIETSQPSTRIGNERTNDGNNLPFQRWSFLRGNYLNYLQQVKPRGKRPNPQTCRVCNNASPCPYSCYVDSGNESNPYCEETDGDESSLFGFGVDNVTQSSIDSAMDQFQNYFNLQTTTGTTTNPDDQTTASMVQWKPQDSQFQNSRQGSSFVSFRKEGKSESSDNDTRLVSSLINDDNFMENSDWKTLRKARSFSDDANAERDRKKMFHRQSISFDSGKVDETYSTVGGHNIFDRSLLETAESCKRDSNGQEGMGLALIKPMKAAEEAHKVSIVKDSKTVKSIFYIKAKLNDQAFRSYSLPEYSLDDDGEGDGRNGDHDRDENENDHESTKRNEKHDRFALVKKAWKSFDDDVLDLLNNRKEYIELKKDYLSHPPPPIEKKCAEISLKLMEERKHPGSNHESDDNDDDDDKETEEILEVVIENNVVSDGFATENDEDDESIVPTSPTSVRLESGLSSMKDSPVNEASCQHCLRCSECLDTLCDARTTTGLSPLSIEMSKSDYSDWSDDAIPDRSYQGTQHQKGHNNLIRNYSPQIMDLPRFPAMKSPIRSPTITLSPSMTSSTPHFVNSSPRTRYCSSAAALPQSHIYNSKGSSHKLSRRAGSLDDSDILTEDSSISGSASGEDNHTKDILSFETNRTQPGFCVTDSADKSVEGTNSVSDTVSTKKLKLQIPSPTPISVPSSPKSTQFCEEGMVGKDIKQRLKPIESMKCTGLNYRLTPRNKEFPVDAPVPRKENRTGCHCLCQDVTSHIGNYYLSKKRHGFVNNGTRHQYGAPLFPLPEVEDGPDHFLEKEIIPTKYKELAFESDSSMSTTRSSLQKDFHWDATAAGSNAEGSQFVERTLTPTKYRKKTTHDTHDSYINEGNTKSPELDRQKEAINSLYSTYQQHSDTFNTNSNTGSREKEASVLQDVTNVLSSYFNNDLPLVNSMERNIGFMHFMYEMMMKANNDDATQG